MIRVIIWVLILILSSIILLIDDLYFKVALTLVNFLLSFFIINKNNFTNNFLNPQSIFMLGFLLFLLGRFVGVIFEPNYLDSLFCTSFIFNYCASNAEIQRIFIYLNSILIFFSLGFVFIPKKIFLEEKEIIDKNKIYFIFVIGFLCSIFSIFDVIQNIKSAIGGGYLAIYSEQSAEYETPVSLVFNALSISVLAILYSKRNNQKCKFLFKILISIILVKMFLNILTGSRALFVSGVILLLWFLFSDKNFKMQHYLISIFSGISLVAFINKIASLSNARVIESNISGFMENLAYVFYNQGITLMVFNSSLRVESYPTLGFLKIIFPGIQVFYKYFGITERKDFNWSSYIVYNENIVAYFNGNGLGWSLYSDLYAFSFGYLFIFCLFIFLFSKFIVYVVSRKNSYNDGLVLILILTLFSINRSSISSLIFFIVVYTIIYIYCFKIRGMHR